MPSEGDSLNYHIPIAKNILSGNIIFQKNIIEIEQWYPGATEVILGLFILLHIPLNLFNVLAIAIFAIVLYQFGKLFLKNKDLALIFATSIASLYGVFRLAHTQNVDIWLAVYFLLLIILFESPKKNLIYFLKLGFLSGMLIGSKYTGPLLFLILSAVYVKDILKILNFKRLFIFLVPFSVFGLFWYFRNFILTGSPVYPQSLLFFKGLPGWNSYLNSPMWKAFLNTPTQMINAYVSEFMIWPLLAVFLFIFLLIFYKRFFKKKGIASIKKPLFISLLFFLIYLFLPYDNLYLGMVLSMRYTYGLLALIGISIFMITEFLGLSEVLALILLTNTLVLFFPPYHPKFIFIYEPLVLLLLIVLFREKFKKSVDKLRKN